MSSRQPSTLGQTNDFKFSIIDAFKWVDFTEIMRLSILRNPINRSFEISIPIRKKSTSANPSYPYRPIFFLHFQLILESFPFSCNMLLAFEKHNLWTRV